MSICIGGVSTNNNRDEIVGIFIREMVCIFSSQTFFCINTPTISTRLLFVLAPPLQMEQTVCSETSAYKIQTAGKHPKVRIQHCLSLLKFPIYLQCLLNLLTAFLFGPYYFISVLLKNSFTSSDCVTVH